MVPGDAASGGSRWCVRRGREEVLPAPRDAARGAADAERRAERAQRFPARVGACAVRLPACSRFGGLRPVLDGECAQAASLGGVARYIKNI